MAHHWRDGRFHCGFTAEKSLPVGAEIEATVEVIRILIQLVQGGNKVSADHFTYSNDKEGGRSHRLH
jgi:hypothetical protein